MTRAAIYARFVQGVTRSAGVVPERCEADVAEQRRRIEAAVVLFIVEDAGEAQRAIDGALRRPADEQGDRGRHACDRGVRRSRGSIRGNSPSASRRPRRRK